jgi:hypothetical protein
VVVVVLVVVVVVVVVCVCVCVCACVRGGGVDEQAGEREVTRCAHPTNYTERTRTHVRLRTRLFS